jgi:hypothetical protein
MMLEWVIGFVGSVKDPNSLFVRSKGETRTFVANLKIMNKWILDSVELNRRRERWILSICVTTSRHPQFRVSGLHLRGFLFLILFDNNWKVSFHVGTTDGVRTKLTRLRNPHQSIQPEIRNDMDMAHCRSSSSLIHRYLRLVPRFRTPMSTLSYQAAVERLNSLQSNAATLEAVRASGGRLSEFAIPEMLEYLERIGYKVSGQSASDCVLKSSP